MKARTFAGFPRVIRIFGTAILLSSPAHAIVWEGNFSADWSDPANWTGGVVPDSTGSAEFIAPLNGDGLAIPSSLVLLSLNQSALSLTVTADALTLGSASGAASLNLVSQGTDLSDAGLVISGGLLDLASPVAPDSIQVPSSLLLADQVRVNSDYGFIGGTSGDDAALILAGGRLDVSANLEIGTVDGSGRGTFLYTDGGYSNLNIGGSLVVHDGSVFDTNQKNAFASIGTVDLQAGSTTRIGKYFQLWTDSLQIEDGATFTWETQNENEWSQIWIRTGDFQIDGETLSTAVFGEMPRIDGGKSFKLSEGMLSIHDGQTLKVDGAFTGFSPDGGSWSPTWFTTVDVGGIQLEGSGAIDFASGSIGLNGQALVIGAEGMFKDADDGNGGPNVMGNLTLGGNRGIAVANGPSVDGSEAGLTTIRAGATLTIDGGAFFTNTLMLESAGSASEHFDFSGLTRVEVTLDDVPVVEFRDSDDDAVYRLFNINGGLGLQDVGNSAVYDSGVALSFDQDGVFTGVDVGGSTAGDGKLDFKNGFFGIGTDLLFTGDSRSTISQDENYVVGGDQRLLSLGTIRIGTELSTLSQVKVTLDGGSLTAAAIRIGPGGALVFNGGSLTLQDNYSDDSNLVIGTVDESGIGQFKGNPYSLGDLDSHLGDAFNTNGGAPGDAVFGANVNVSTENLTLLDGSLLTLDGGSLLVRHEVRLGGDGARLDFVRGSLNLNEAPVTIGAGGLLGNSLELGADKNLFVNNLTLESGGTLIVDGGYLGSTNFQSDAGATIDFQSGYIYLGPSVSFGSGDEANHPFGASLELSGARSLAINGPALLESGASVTVNGGLFDPSGGLTIDAGASLSWTSGTLGSTGNRFTLQNSGDLEISVAGDGQSRNLNANIANSGVVSIQGGNDGLLQIEGAVNNSGTWKVTVPTGQLTRIQYESTFRITGSGSYQSDPADNAFTHLVVEGSGSLTGQSGDRFIVSGDLQNSSAADWSVTSSELVFTGGTHSITGLTNPNQGFNEVTLESGANLIGDLTAFNILNVASQVGITGDLIAEGVMNFEIHNGDPGLAISGALQLSGPLNLFFSPDFVYSNQTIQLISVNGGPVDLKAVTVNFTSDMATFDSATGILTVIPEPGISLLVVFGSAIGILRRRRG